MQQSPSEALLLCPSQRIHLSTENSILAELGERRERVWMTLDEIEDVDVFPLERLFQLAQRYVLGV